MQYDVNFGTLSGKPRAAAPNTKFRLALLGDFSGRANAGQAETGEALARRKPIKVDVDTLDDVLARMKLSLTLSLDGERGGGVGANRLDGRFPPRPDRRRMSSCSAACAICGATSAPRPASIAPPRKCCPGAARTRCRRCRARRPDRRSQPTANCRISRA